MEELKAMAEVLNAGGNAALILCAVYIFKNTQATNRVADRLARIESKMNIESSDTGVK